MCVCVGGVGGPGPLNFFSDLRAPPHLEWVAHRQAGVCVCVGGSALLCEKKLNGGFKKRKRKILSDVCVCGLGGGKKIQRFSLAPQATHTHITHYFSFSFLKPPSNFFSHSRALNHFRVSAPRAPPTQTHTHTCLSVCHPLEGGGEVL